MLFAHIEVVRRISGNHRYSIQTGGVHFCESVSMRQQSRPQIYLNVSIGTILPHRQTVLLKTWQLLTASRNTLQTATGPYPKQSVSNPVSCNLLPKDLSSYYSPIYVCIPQVITSLQVFWQFCLHFPLLPYALNVLPISHFDLFTVRIVTNSKTGQHSSK